MSSVTSRASNLLDYRVMSQSFEEMTGYMAFFGYESYILIGDGQPERLVGVGVARNFLEVLGVQPLLGRNFVEEESVWDGRPAAILTHGMALGESAAAVRMRVVSRTMTLAGTGVVIGAVASFIVACLMRSMLFGVEATDAMTFEGMAFVLMLVSGLAGYLPARRASRTNPIDALRVT